MDGARLSAIRRAARLGATTLGRPYVSLVFFPLGWLAFGPPTWVAPTSRLHGVTDGFW